MSAIALIDPREAGPKPPYRAKSQDPPGAEAAMSVPADHGETSYKGSGKLAGLAALITGADSGIGRAVALAYAREGADVLVSYLSEDADAKETERLVTEAGRRCILVPGDVQSEDHCKALVARAVEEFGRLDVLVNNAGYQEMHESIQDVTAEDMDRTFRTNVFAMIYLCKAALPRMKPGASIVNTASIQGYRPYKTLLTYAPSKSAIIGFTKALASQAMGQGVRVNAVAPGPVWTPLIPSTIAPKMVDTLPDETVYGRVAQPAEIAPLFVWLASPEATYVTAEVFGATGGQSPF